MDRHGQLTAKIFRDRIDQNSLGVRHTGAVEHPLRCAWSQFSREESVSCLNAVGAQQFATASNPPYELLEILVGTRLELPTPLHLIRAAIARRLTY